MRCPEPQGAAMRRRDFVRVVVSLAAGFPFAARTQQREQKRRVAVLMGGLLSDDLGGQAEAAAKVINAISRKPPAPTWLFALAAAAGAVALSVIFGVEHFTPMVLIFISAGAGGFLRRALGQLTANEFIQPFSAAILAGL